MNVGELSATVVREGVLTFNHMHVVAAHCLSPKRVVEIRYDEEWFPAMDCLI